MDLRAFTGGERRDLYNGFGESLARAFELVATSMLFGFFGWLLDGRLGTRPLFTLTFFLFVLGYECWKLWGGYTRSMQSEEQRVLRKGATDG